MRPTMVPTLFRYRAGLPVLWSIARPLAIGR